MKRAEKYEEKRKRIEELKMELSTIMVTRTAAGREKFDTPEIKLGTGKKGRMRKDRYSSLIIAKSTSMTAILAFFAMRRKLVKRQWLAIIISFLGVAIINLLVF